MNGLGYSIVRIRCHLIDQGAIAMNQAGFNLGSNPYILTRCVKSANHVELHLFQDFSFQVIGIGSPSDGFVFK